MCDKPTLDLLEMVGLSTAHQKNSYGLLRAPWNMLENPKITRRSEVCGAANNAQFDRGSSTTATRCTRPSRTHREPAAVAARHVHTTGGAFGECAETFPSLESVLPTRRVRQGLRRVTIKSRTSRRICGRRASSPVRRRRSAAWRWRRGAPAHAPARRSTAPGSRRTRRDAQLGPLEADKLRGEHRHHGLDPVAGAAGGHHQGVCNTDTLTGDMVGSNSPLDITFFDARRGGAHVPRRWYRGR